MYLVVTGGSGFIGTHLCKALHQQGHKVVAVGPNPPNHENKEIVFIQTNLAEGEVPPVFADCDAIIHLAGANIFHRWTNNYKQLILDSRLTTAHAIYHFLLTQKKRPKSFISASAVGFYGDRGDEILDEQSSYGTDFLASTCVACEKAREMFSSLGMRAVSIRTATVLSPDGGALSKMLPLFRWGLGGKLGHGTQWFPWIHIDDLVNIYMQAACDLRIIGPINAAAPELIRNIEFTKTVGSILKRPTILSIPSFVLRLGLGEFATVLLSSQRVLPRALERLGFSFTYPTLQKALTLSIYTAATPKV
ncbi:MAG: TIGR01777 family oxidoreductase [Chlamydiales bacterium]